MYPDRMERVGVIERAFQLASGSETLQEVKLKLTREGYASVEAHLAGPQIKRDLKLRMKSNQGECGNGAVAV